MQAVGWKGQSTHSPEKFLTKTYLEWDWFAFFVHIPERGTVSSLLKVFLLFLSEMLFIFTLDDKLLGSITLCS